MVTMSVVGDAPVGRPERRTARPQAVFVGEGGWHTKRLGGTPSYYILLQKVLKVPTRHELVMSEGCPLLSLSRTLPGSRLKRRAKSHSEFVDMSQIHLRLCTTMAKHARARAAVYCWPLCRKSLLILEIHCSLIVYCYLFGIVYNYYGLNVEYGDFLTNRYLTVK